MEERCSRHWSSHWTSTTTATGHSRSCKRSPGAHRSHVDLVTVSAPGMPSAPDAYELERRARPLRLGQRFVDDRPRHRCRRWHRRARRPPAGSAGGDGDLGQAADELVGVRQRHPRRPAPQPRPGAPDRTQRADEHRAGDRPRSSPPSIREAVDDVTVPAIVSWHGRPSAVRPLAWSRSSVRSTTIDRRVGASRLRRPSWPPVRCAPSASS